MTWGLASLTLFGACCLVFNRAQEVRNDPCFVAGETDSACISGLSKATPLVSSRASVWLTAKPILLVLFCFSKLSEIVIQNTHLPGSGLWGTDHILLPITPTIASSGQTPLLWGDLTWAGFLRVSCWRGHPHRMQRQPLAPRTFGLCPGPREC